VAPYELTGLEGRFERRYLSKYMTIRKMMSHFRSRGLQKC